MYKNDLNERIQEFEEHINVDGHNDSLLDSYVDVCYELQGADYTLKMLKQAFFMLSDFDQPNISENYIREFENEINWKCISKNQKLSEGFVQEFQDNVQFELLDIGINLYMYKFLFKFKHAFTNEQLQIFYRKYKCLILLMYYKSMNNFYMILK